MNTFRQRSKRERVAKKKKKKEVSDYSLQGGTTLKSHVLVVTCNTFQFVEYYYQKSKSHQAWCVQDSWPIKLGGRSHQLYFPQKPINLGTSHKNHGGFINNTGGWQRKNNKFLLGVICPLQSLKGHYDLNLSSKSSRVDGNLQEP